MTEKRPGRIDLRPIDEPADARQADRVIAAVMGRMGAQRAPADDALAGIVVFARPLLAAAAVFLVIASGTLIALRGRTRAQEPVSVLASWAETNHVPTNGELLAAFKGYSP